MDMRNPAIHFSATAMQDMPTERLPFTVRRVETEDSLRKAVGIRHAAYARHVPDFARTLALPEACDYADDTVVLLAESRLDGTPLGTARIQTNLNGPLHVEDSVALPEWLQGRRLAEVTRLGVDEGRIGRVVKIALIKAAFEYCEQNGIDYAVVTGRAPIDRQYEQLLFSDVFDNKEMIPLRHVGNIPHRVMAFEIATGEARWTAAKHPLLAYFRHTRHPDIDIAPRAKNVFKAARAGRPALSTPLMRSEFAVA
jgi:GNAT superfamily N-acetyltransferase